MTRDQKIVAQFQRRFSHWGPNYLCLYHHHHSICRYDRRGQLLELHLCDQSLTEIPPEVCRLTNLQQLYLTGNHFRVLPSELSSLTNLQELYVDSTMLFTLPVELGNLTNLKTLDASLNGLTTLPVELGNLINLQTLNLSHNKLTTLPAELGNLTNLRRLDLSGNNKLLTLPAFIYEENIDVIREYLRTQLLTATAEANEAKPQIPQLETTTKAIARESRPITIFYCYAHEDRDLRNRLDKHLGILKRLGQVTGWYDQEIQAGTAWEQEIDTHLSAANIVLLLVSADFVNSDYCYGVEMQKALEMHEKGKACVLPILLRPLDWRDAPFAKLQMLPTGAKPITSWSDPEEALEDVAKQVRAVVNTLRTRRS